jgi:hypothetical protein
MTMVCERRTDAVIAWAVDRLTRRMADLESIITDATKAGVVIVTANGDLDLSTDTGRMVARILGSVATAEVERKGSRQRLANQQKARQGQRWRSSQRPFGWSKDDYAVPVPEEAEAIREACRLILAGASLSGVIRTWTAMGVRPAQGERWTRQSARAILLNPAIAGLRSYKGEIIGRGDWGDTDGDGGFGAIVREEVWTAVRSVLTDPQRQVPRGTRSLLGGIGTCRCGNKVTHTHAQQGHGKYACQHSSRVQDGKPHVSIKSSVIDEHVVNVLISTMQLPDAAEIFAAAKSAVDVQALRDEAQAIRRNLETYAKDAALSRISRGEYLAMRDAGHARLTEIGQAVTEASREHVAAELVCADDMRATWDGLDISRKRAIIRALMRITLTPAGKGRRVSVTDADQVVSIGWSA